jgi:hemerythrin superfamily protein
MGDIFELLRTDHAEVKGMLSMLESSAGTTRGSEERKKQVEQLVIEESKHEAAEEQYFWPTVREKLPNGDSLAATALAQEQEGKEVLDRLDGMDPGEGEFETLIGKFIKAGREHIAYEEDQVWPGLQTALTTEEREELGGKFEQAKKMAPTRPHPGTPPNPAVLKTAGMVAGVMDKARDSVSDRGQ